MNFFIVLPFFLKYLANAEYMISSRSVASKATLIIPDNFLRIYNTWDKFTINRKLLKVDVLIFETCWAVNSGIIMQVTSSWSILTQQFCLFFFCNNHTEFIYWNNHLFLTKTAFNFWWLLYILPSPHPNSSSTYICRCSCLNNWNLRISKTVLPLSIHVTEKTLHSN